jgi:hypothetical protein
MGGSGVVLSRTGRPTGRPVNCYATKSSGPGARLSLVVVQGLGDGALLGVLELLGH